MTTNGAKALGIVGNLNVDLWVRPVDRMPVWDEEVLVESARLELAGTAGYVMLACKGLGIDIVPVSAIGDDSFGEYLRAELERLQIPSAGVEVLPGEETSLGIILIGSDGSRGILSTLGAHGKMDLDLVRRHDVAVAACGEVLFCGNYLLPHLSPAQILPYAREVRQRGQLVLFDPSWDPSGWTDTVRRETFELLQTVDVYLPNEAELLHLTGRSDLRVVVKEVAELATEVVVKRGAEGAIYATASEWIEVPAFPVSAVNTIGAGDVFDVGYLFGRRMNWPPRQRMQFAAALAAMVVAQTGPRTYPDVAAVSSFLRERMPPSPTAWEKGVGE